MAMTHIRFSWVRTYDEVQLIPVYTSLHSWARSSKKNPRVRFTSLQIPKATSNQLQHLRYGAVSGQGTRDSRQEHRYIERHTTHPKPSVQAEL